MNTALAKSEHFKPSVKNRKSVYKLALQSPEQNINDDKRQTFINAMANTVNGVHVVTTDGYAGRYGLTVNTVTSVSADPPMILVCINRRSPMSEAIHNNGVFCINILSHTQSKIAEIFAGHPKSGKPYDFSRNKWEQGVTGLPRLSKALANFDCILETSIDAGSHTIFIGRVVETVARDGAPLLYNSRSYGFPYLMGY